MRKESLEFLRNLLTSASPSGFESPGQKVWCEYARKYADEVRTDSYGNAVAVLNPGGSPKVMFDAHVDELGLIVKHIDKDGYLYFQQIGGVDPALLRGKRVDIHTAKGVVRGVVGAVPIHLQERDKDPKPPKIHDLFIDIGAKDAKEAAKRVAVGDPMTFIDDFELLTDRLIVARACDDRVGAWAALDALRMIASRRKELKAAVYACSSVQEEVGLHGARMSVMNVQPDVAIAVEVTHATDVPGIDVKRFGEVKMGKGPTVSIGRENHPVVVDLLRKIAKRK